MVFEKDKLREHLERYLACVCREIDVHKVVLYGSYAYGIPHDDSDIDLVILSNDFAQMPKLKRHQWLGWLAWQAGTDYIQPLGFTSKELDSASPLSLLGEVRERGVVVYEKDNKLT
jgi:stress-induced morphogen